jgi:ABC-type glutathione transport system ATPase component
VVTQKKRREEAERLMKYFGVYEQRNKVPNELSGGQQQRVAICRSLINDPEIIFADEPVGNLDSKSAHDVLGLIQELNIKHKKTVILVTHDPSHLDIADRVFFMKDGKVIDTKVNKETRKITIEKPGEEAKKSNLELVSKTLATSEHMGIGGLFLEYKVKEIVSDALTGLTIEEVSGIERRVSEILKNKLSDYRDLEDYLDREYTFGGLDLNKRTAHRLTDNIRGVVEEMKTLVEASASSKKSLSYVEKLRFNLLDTFDVHVSSTDVVERIESIIHERVEGRTDRKGVQVLLDTSVAQGGAGLDRRDAKRMSKHLELLLLTRYDGEVKNDKEGHSQSQKTA